MSKSDRARKREQRRGYAKPSAPRVIGANDNAVNDNERAAARSDAQRTAKALQHEREMEAAATLAANLKAQGDVDVHHVGTKVTAKRVGGLEWLFRKGRITMAQYRAGGHYADDFALAEASSIRSCLNDHVGGGQGEAAQEVRRAAADRLRRIRTEVLHGHSDAIALVDLVCGRGIRILHAVDGDREMAARKEAQLALSLDFMARFYGIV